MVQFKLDRLREQTVGVFPNCIMHHTMVCLSLDNARLEIILDPVQSAKTLKKKKKKKNSPGNLHAHNFSQKLIQIMEADTQTCI